VCSASIFENSDPAHWLATPSSVATMVTVALSTYALVSREASSHGPQISMRYRSNSAKNLRAIISYATDK